MKTHTTNYKNTLIEIAEDCKAAQGCVPPQKKNGPSVAEIQFDLLQSQPYTLTSDDVLFETFAIRNSIPENEKAAARQQFFEKPQACLRCSPLGKTYGWGIHSDEKGRVALVSAESKAYQALLDDADITKTKAMRSKRG